MTRVSVHKQQILGWLEFFGIGSDSLKGNSGSSVWEAQRIVLNPPGIVRDTVALGIRASLVLGAVCGEVEGVRWEKEAAG